MEDKIFVNVGEPLFTFSSYDEWVETAPDKFKNASVHSYHVVCIDSVGNICRIGKDFMYAQSKNLYPVRVYAYRKE